MVDYPQRKIKERIDEQENSIGVCRRRDSGCGMRGDRDVAGGAGNGGNERRVHGEGERPGRGRDRDPEADALPQGRRRPVSQKVQ